jgi:hypothetical protein
MGHNQGNSNSQIVQEFPPGSSIFSTAAFWQNHLFLGGAGGHLKAFALNTSTSQFNTTATSNSTASYGFPGPTPSISASGSTKRHCLGAQQ